MQKDRRKRRQQQRQEEKEQKAAAAAANADNEEDEEQDMDLLPDVIIDSIVADESKDRRILERRVITEQLRIQRPKKKKFFTERHVGPVTVKVLKSGIDRNASGMFSIPKLHITPSVVHTTV